MGSDVDSGFLMADLHSRKHLFTNIEMLYESNGGICCLYRAQRDGKWLALKTLKEEYKESELLKKLFYKEFDYSYNIEHPNAVRALGMEVIDGVGECIVFEYIDGMTLKDFIKSKYITNVRAIRIIKELCSALSYIHCKQIVHRDLRPENIMITHNGNHVKIIDFGYADSNDAAILKASAGTPKYASPEVIAGKIPDGRADIYALGVLIYDMFNGSPKGSFKSVANKCLQKDRNSRYQYAEEVCDDLTFKRKNNKYLFLTICILLAGIFALWYYYDHQGTDVYHKDSNIENREVVNKLDAANDYLAEQNLSNEIHNSSEVKKDIQSNKTTIDNKVYKGEIEFSYGKYTGDISEGKPHGQGSMHYSSSVLINSSDEKQRFSEKGDTFTGKFHKGLPEYGKLYNSLGELKAVMNFGRAK